MGQRVSSSDGHMSLEIMHCLIRQLLRRKQLQVHDVEIMIAELRQRANFSPLSGADGAADTLITWLLEIEDDPRSDVRNKAYASQASNLPS